MPVFVKFTNQLSALRVSLFYEDDDYRLLTCISRRLMHWKGGYLMEIRLQFDFLIVTSLSMGSMTINTRPTMVNCDIICI